MGWSVNAMLTCRGHRNVYSWAGGGYWMVKDKVCSERECSYWRIVRKCVSLLLAFGLLKLGLGIHDPDD
jgi:hypothetical protein